MYWIIGLAVGAVLALVAGCARFGGSITLPVGRADVTVGVDQKGGFELHVDPQDQGK